MRTFAVGLLVLSLLAGGERLAGAQDADPLGLTRAALMPYFNISPGNLFFLLLASPVGDNSGAGGNPPLHLWFYSAACVRQESAFMPMTENDTQAVLINGRTALSEGLILIAGTIDGTSQIPLEGHEIIARGVWIDLVADHARVLDPALGVPVEGGGAWTPFKDASIHIFAPPDDGVTFFDRVIFSCPIGTTTNTLAKDMQQLAPFTPASTITLQAAVYDESENPLTDWTMACRCIGVTTGAGTFNVPRLSQISPVYATNTTYTEITSGSDRHMGYMDIEVHSGGNNVDIFGRLHPVDACRILGTGCVDLVVLE